MFESMGLVLEGGGMRGVFTIGALDCLLDNKIYFPYVVGVSAGASNGLSYASRQRGRAKFCNIDQLEARQYIDIKRFFSRRGVMDLDFLFDELPKEIYPYDFKSYVKFGTRMVLAATNCLTGRPVYFDTPKTFDTLLEACRASCSIPYICPITEINSVPMLDGGVSDPIPARRAIADGFAKNLIILTRNRGYRKSSYYYPLAARIMYRKYPLFRESLKKAHELYNDALGYAESLEASGDALIIRPKKPLRVGRLECDVKKLSALYDEGYLACEEVLEKIKTLSASAKE